MCIQYLHTSATKATSTIVGGGKIQNEIKQKGCMSKEYVFSRKILNDICDNTFSEDLNSFGRPF